VGLHSIRLYLEPNPGGVYTVTSPDVPGLVTEGSTPTEILNNVQEALDALAEAWQALGKGVPPALRPVLADRSHPALDKRTPSDL
jgi:antitoxin HicB